MDSFLKFLSDNPQHLSIVIVGGLFFWLFRHTLGSLFNTLQQCLERQAEFDAKQRQQDREEHRKNLEMIVNTFTCIGVKVDYLTQHLSDTLRFTAAENHRNDATR